MLKNVCRVSCTLSLLLFLCAGNAFADKSSVVITAPAEVKKGSEVTVQIKVIHEGNNFMHHVDWLQVKLNGKELKRWDYSWTSKPESASFTREVKFIANEPITLVAEADCNMHGSKGPGTKQIRVTE